MSSDRQRVFLSYSLKDRAQAHSLATALRDRGIDAWIDIDDLAPGTDLSEAIEERIRESDGIVCFVTGSAVGSPLVRREWESALTASWERPELRLIPVVDRGAIPPGFLRDRQWIRPPASALEEENWSSVAAEIAQALAGGTERDATYRASAARERKEWAEEMGKEIAPLVQEEKLRGG